jgi:hypothetical protein
MAGGMAAQGVTDSWQSNNAVGNIETDVANTISKINVSFGDVDPPVKAAQGIRKPNIQAADAVTFISFGLDLGSNLSYDYRKNLFNARTATPLMLKVNGQTPSIAKINAWGVTSKFLGRAAIGVSLISDTKEFLNGDISSMRYTYRMTGTAASVFVASRLGGWPGTTVGLGFVAGEMFFDLGSWFGRHLVRALTDLEYGLKNGWYPKTR